MFRVDDMSLQLPTAAHAHTSSLVEPLRLPVNR